MKKLLKVLFGTVLLLAGIGVGVYYVGSKLVADQVMEQVAAGLEDSGQLDLIKEEIQNDPELRSFVEEAKNVDSSSLPFQTKDQAVRVLAKKFSVSEINEVQTKAMDGLSAQEKQELLNRFQDRLSEEELLALKVLAYKEYAN